MRRPRVIARWSVAAVLVLAACGPRPRDPADGTLEKLGWLRGDWAAADGKGAEHWVDPGGTLYGVALRDDGFEVMMVDEDPPLVFGPLALFAMPEGKAAVRFPLAQQDERAIRFENLQHDDPTTIRYTREGSELTATVSTRGVQGPSFRFTPGPTAAAAPELDAADRVFAKDTQERGAAGWAAHYAADGAMGLSGEDHVQGPAAIEAHMTELFGSASLRWTPTTSRRRGRYGFTAGTFELEGKSYRESGTYVSVWRLDDDGTWRVVFDVGRTQSRATR